MKGRFLLSLTALCSLAMAQTIHTPTGDISLGGTLDSPEIQNHSNLGINGFTMIAFRGMSRPSVDVVFMSGDIMRGRVGIAPGASRVYKPWARTNSTPNPPAPVTAWALDSVLLEDGHFLGPDAAKTFSTFVVRVNAAANFSHLAATRPEHWALMEEMTRRPSSAEEALAQYKKASIQGSRDSHAMFQADSTAGDLMRIKIIEGDEEAHAAAQRLSQIPGVWR